MTSPAADYFEISDYVRVLRRRWLTVAGLTLAGLVLAAGYVFLAPRQYTGTVLVQVTALPSDANAVGGRTGGPVNMDNEAQAVRSGAVASIMKDRMDSAMSTADIANLIKVVVPPNTTYLQISVAGPTAATAQRWANAVGYAYLAQRRVSTQTLIGTGIQALQARAARLRSTIERLKVLIYSNRHNSRNPSGSPVIVGDELLLSGAQTALASVQAHIDDAIPLYESLSVPDSVIVGSIVTPASLPSSPSSPRKLLVLPSGLMAGLIVGLAVAFVSDRRDKRVHSVREAERLADLPVLLDLAVSGQAVTALESPRTRAGQAFGEFARYVRTAFGDGEHVLVVAASAPGTGGSVVAGNLAAALARAGDETAVICADLRGSTVPELLGVDRGRGVSEVLAGTASARDVAVAGPVPGLRVIPPGLDPHGAAQAMPHTAVSLLIGELLGEARYVVIELQSLGESGETFGLAEFAEAAILTVQPGRSRSTDLADCVQRLARLGTPAIGMALLPASPAGRRGRKAAAAVPTARPPAARGYDGSGHDSRARDRRTRDRRARDRQAPDRQAEPGAPGPMPAAGATMWPSRAPRASAEPPEFTGASAGGARRATETWPIPRVAVTERDGYSDLADPGPED
ncbi:MAG TPA: Wzz/FepE/Etk N-terminal domain-containing protein [Streptosporangiaceae bacterium]